MTKGNAITALQKTYDDCHLVCSTAIYFESRGDEIEALRCWKNARDQINYSHIYRLPSSYQPKSEAEKALYHSLRQLELQCQERINLIEALKKSREEAGEAADNGTFTPAPTTATQGWLGNGTIPPMSSTDLAKPPGLPTRPLPPRSISAESSGPKRSAYKSSSSFKNEKSSRSPSPEKQSKLRSTLRGERGKKASSSPIPRPPRPPAASKAASQAWTTKKDFPGLGSNPATYEQSKDAAFLAARLGSGLTRLDPFDGFDGNFTNTNDGDIDRPSSDVLDHTRSRDSSYNLGKVSSLSALDQDRKSTREERRPQVDKDSRVGGLPRTRHNPSPRIRSNPKSSHITRTPPSETQSRRQVTRPQPALRRKPVNVSPEQPLQNSSSSSDDLDDKEDEEEEEPTPAESWKLFTARVLDKLPRGIDPGAATQILNEIIIQGDQVRWSDIAGLEIAKAALKENVVYPFLRPDLFMGLREPARGMLLFGPPGTGKTMLARAVATESKSTFFAISASSLVSKFLGESEKLVRALFTLAKMLAPSIIFVDEIDSLLSSRSETGEHEASRRIKTEFLIQWSDLARAAAGREDNTAGIGNRRGDPSRVLVLAATNAPWAIDDAARRRFVRRQYIPLPEAKVRIAQIRTLLAHQKQSLTEEDVENLVDLTEGFSGSDITALAKDAAMGPLRSLGDSLLDTRPEDIRPIGFEDFVASLQTIRSSVSKQGLQQFEDWAREYGERGG